MKDVEIAKKHLEEENIAIVVIKDGKLIFQSNEKGIKPMYTLVTKMKEIAKGASIADRVIGKGAAMLCKHIGIKEVYSQLISENAIDVLEESNILYSYDKICSYIKNRDKTDLCPIEKMATNIEHTDILLENIGEFLERQQG